MSFSNFIARCDVFYVGDFWQIFTNHLYADIPTHAMFTVGKVNRKPIRWNFGNQMVWTHGEKISSPFEPAIYGGARSGCEFIDFDPHSGVKKLYVTNNGGRYTEWSPSARHAIDAPVSITTSGGASVCTYDDTLPSSLLSHRPIYASKQLTTKWYGGGEIVPRSNGGFTSQYDSELYENGKILPNGRLSVVRYIKRQRFSWNKRYNNRLVLHRADGPATITFLKVVERINDDEITREYESMDHQRWSIDGDSINGGRIGDWATKNDVVMISDPETLLYQSAFTNDFDKFAFAANFM